MDIQHSLNCCKDGQYYRHLQSLYDAGELTNAINRIIEEITHRFVLRTFTRSFKSHDLGSTAQLMRKETDPIRRSDALDRINTEDVTKRLMELLDIRNAHDLRNANPLAHASAGLIDTNDSKRKIDECISELRKLLEDFRIANNL